MPKNPKQIASILKVIQQEWEKFPNLRLGQLIKNAMSGHRNTQFHIEDEDLIDAINRYVSMEEDLAHRS